MPTPDFRDRRNFPRGLVLGLTMAETMVIVVFVLLLAMTMLLESEPEGLHDEEEQRRQAEAGLQEMQDVLTEHGFDQANITDFNDWVAKNRAQSEDWEELVSGLPPDAPPPSPDTMVSRLREAHDISEALDAADIDSTPDALREMAEVVRAVRDAGIPADDLRDDLRDAIRVREELADAWDDATADDPDDDESTGPTPRALTDIVRDARSWRAQSSGRGGKDYPSCWENDDGTTAYLFEVDLRDDGYVLRLTRAHTQARERPPIDGIRTGQVLNSAEFETQTKDVYNWSVANGCRFYVRAIDRTGASKDLFKDRMRTLELWFYKYEVRDPAGPPPEVDEG